MTRFQWLFNMLFSSFLPFLRPAAAVTPSLMTVISMGLKETSQHFVAGFKGWEGSLRTLQMCCPANADASWIVESSSLLRLSATSGYLTCEELAQKLLPGVCHRLVDPDQAGFFMCFSAICRRWETWPLRPLASCRRP